MMEFGNLMKALTVAVAVCISFAASALTSTERHFTFRHRGMDREYMLYVPEGIGRNAPLVVVLHGYGGRAMKGGENLREVADREKFVVCYAQGAVDAKGKTCWNVGYPFQEGLKTDDVDFLCKLARHLQKTYGLSRENTFLTGMSNGGEMCYLMAYLRPDVFAAVAPISGLTLVWMDKELKAGRHIPVMEVHGTRDKTSAWAGDPENKGGWGAYLSVPMAVAKWAVEAKCTHEVTENLPEKRNKVVLHRYCGGEPAWKDGPETEVWLYEVIGGKHSWAEADMDTCSEIWRFFSRYLR